MRKTNEPRSIKVGLGFALTVSFVVLKLTGQIVWSWWWVLAPTWVPLALALLIALVLGLFIMFQK